MALTDISIISGLEPIATLSPSRLSELAGLCFVEKVSKNLDPFRMNVLKSAQALYLLKGDLGVLLENGSKKVIQGGTEAARHPVDPEQLAIKDAIALTEIEIVRVDLDLLDIMMTWDQLASGGVQDTDSPSKREPQHYMNESAAFSAGKLQSGVFSRLPAANIEEMFRRMRPMEVTAGQIIIRQGAEGDYYYIIEEGVAVVSRADGLDGKAVPLAELKAMDAFGEEALVSDNKRNATVTMKTNGRLLRLDKQDFVELLKAPLINEIGLEEAKSAVVSGAQWLDVRLPSEFKFDHQPGAINVPLNQIRQMIPTLDKSRQYIVYCQTGRRSSAAAFILLQHHLNVRVLEKVARN